MKVWGLSRRNFFRALGGITLGGLASQSGLTGSKKALAIDPDNLSSNVTSRGRAVDIRRFRQGISARSRQLRRTCNRRLAKQRWNRDHQRFGEAFGFSKVLPKSTGDILPNRGEFNGLLRGIRRGKFAFFETDVASGAKGFKNPLGAFASDLTGFDATQYNIPAAPAVDSEECAGELSELYWMALCRDVPFSDFWTSSLVSDAISFLSSEHPSLPVLRAGSAAPDTVFRCNMAEREIGPYISQFLWQGVQTGRLAFDQRIETTAPGSDWLTREDFYRHRAGGNADNNTHAFVSTPRYIVTPRDLAMYVWDDRTFMPYLNAFFILYNAGTELNRGNPYRLAATTTGFISGEYPHAMSMLSQAATLALKACWWQKWNVHMRMRPEELAARVHFHKTGVSFHEHLPASMINAESVNRILAYNGAISNPGNGATYLLPQVYPEGSPNHPAYPSGHATIAGACITVLKAFFEENSPMPSPVIPNATGSALTPYSGASLTVKGELNKLACNIAEGRNFAGIHYRSDMQEGLLLGEKVAIGMMQQMNGCYTERFRFQFTRFDGTAITIR